VTSWQGFRIDLDFGVVARIHMHMFYKRHISKTSIYFKLMKSFYCQTARRLILFWHIQRVIFAPIDERKLFSNLLLFAQPNSNVMKTQNQINEPEDVIEKSAPIKTLNLQVAVTEPDLPKAVRAAFDLAKSAGLELNLDFNLPSDIGTSQLTLFRVGC
jgi:hypothetical protein